MRCVSSEGEPRSVGAVPIAATYSVTLLDKSFGPHITGGLWLWNWRCVGESQGAGWAGISVILQTYSDICWWPENRSSRMRRRMFIWDSDLWPSEGEGVQIVQLCASRYRICGGISTTLNASYVTPRIFMEAGVTVGCLHLRILSTKDVPRQ